MKAWSATAALGFLVLLPALCAEAWWLSYECAVNGFWTPSNVRYECASFNGRLMIVTHQGWAWKERLQFHPIDAADCPKVSSIDNCPGWNPTSNHRVCGFEYATGEYLSSFYPAPGECKRAKETKSCPKEMLRVTTRFQLVAIPYWFALVLCTLPLARWAKPILRTMEGTTS